MAWSSLVTLQDIVGIKVFSTPGPTSGTRPAVVAAIVKGLLDAGLPPKQIVIWDKHLFDLRLAGYVELAERYGIEIAGSADAGYDPKRLYETALLGNLVWGDLEFGKKGEDVGRKSFVSKLLTRRLTKIIQVTPLLNHNLAQVSGNLFSLAMGSVDNSLRFENSAFQLGEAVPEIYALPEVGDRVVLSVVDALICQYQGEERTLLHYSTMLGQLRFSTDPVALDVLSIHELDRQRQRARHPSCQDQLADLHQCRAARSRSERPALDRRYQSGPRQAGNDSPFRRSSRVRVGNRSNTSSANSGMSRVRSDVCLPMPAAGAFRPNGLGDDRPDRRRVFALRLRCADRQLRDVQQFPQRICLCLEPTFQIRLRLDFNPGVQCFADQLGLTGFFQLGQCNLANLEESLPSRIAQPRRS